MTRTCMTQPTKCQMLNTCGLILLLPVGLFLCCFLIVTSSRRTSRHVMCTHITDYSSYDSIAVVILAAEKMRDLLTEAKG